MTTYKQWSDRIQNLLDYQRQLQLETVTTRFTRMDLIELKLIIETCEDLAERISDYEKALYN